MQVFNKVPNVIFFIILLFNTTSTALASPGDLTVSPTRVIFEGRTRSTQVSLINRGNETTTYRISFTQMRMNENGSFKEITNPGPEENFADSFIRYSPRQVTLEPNKSQTIRLMLRKPANLANGEYRSHLLLHAIPKKSLKSSIEKKASEQEALGIILTPIFRITIPVIVRHGDLHADFSFSDLELIQKSPAYENKPAMKFQLNRSGNRSIYGDILVQYQTDKSSSPLILGKIKDFVVYVPNKTRNSELPLNLPDNVDLSKGLLTMSFLQLHKDKQQILAEKQLSIQ